MGDIVHALPAVAWIKEARTEWKISWLVNTEWAPLLAGNPALEHAILFPRQAFRGIGGVLPFVRWVMGQIRPLRPDMAVDFQGLLRTAMLAQLSGAKSILGLSDAREGAGWFYDDAARTTQGVPHAVERYMALAAKVLGVSESIHRKRALIYPLPPGVMPPGAEKLDGKRYVLLHPFSRGQGKSLNERQVQHICRGLAPHVRVVIAGRDGSGERGALASNCDNYLNKTNLDELIWLIRHAAFVVSVDSGPMHLAAALDKPLVSIHTWSDPRRVGPYRNDAWIWKSGRLFPFSQRHEMPTDLYVTRPLPMQDEDMHQIVALVIRSVTVD